MSTLLVEVDPQYGVHRLVRAMKGRSSHALRQEFPSLATRLPTLWTNSYFVSTVGGSPLAVIQQYREPEAEPTVKLRKVFQFRLRPTAEQAQSLVRLAGARRFAWNWALAQCRAYYVETGKSLPQAELSRRLTALKRLPENAWLSESDSQALQQVLADLHRAYVNFFQKRPRFPRFKSRKTDPPRFRIPQRVAVRDGAVYVPKVGRVRIRQSQPMEGDTKSLDLYLRCSTGSRSQCCLKPSR